VQQVARYRTFVTDNARGTVTSQTEDEERAVEKSIKYRLRFGDRPKRSTVG